MGTFTTIDNLDPLHSKKWAENQQILDPTLTKDDSLVTNKVTVESIATESPTESFPFLPLSFGIQQFAAISPPTGYFQQSGLIFNQKMIPSLGDNKEIEKMIKKLRALKTDKAKDKETLLTFFDLVTDFNDLIEEAKGRLGQYQKG